MLGRDLSQESAITCSRLPYGQKDGSYKDGNDDDDVDHDD